VTVPLLELRGLRVRYGGHPALDGVDLAVDAGETVAVLGANGAGKSTLLRAVMGLVRPDAGMVSVDGRPLPPGRPGARSAAGVGYVPEGRRVFAAMSVRDNLEVAAAAPRRERRTRLERVYALFPRLAERERSLGWQLSGGEQQMLAIGRALMGEPRVLLLDEPSLGLAPRLAGELFARIGAIAAEGTAVLMAEQNAARALAVADRACLLRLGRVVRLDAAAAVAADPALRAAYLG